jgi:alcohol dehydrogenase (cytochrome c)
VIRVLCILLAFAPLAAAQSAGAKSFSGRCASCHGLDGGGGERGPDIVRTPRSRAQSAEDLRRIIRTGVPDAGMPGFTLPDGEMNALVAHVVELRRTALSAPARTEAFKIEPLPFENIAQPKPGEWPTYHGVLSGNRHSPFEQINTKNVQRLAPTWMFTMPNARRLEVTPIVVGGVMYVTSGNQAIALDARTGRQLWHYSRPLTKGVIGDAAGGINRGVAVLGDRVFMVTDHAHLIALNRATGELLWDVEMADYREHYGATSAPLVVNDLVISGTSGGDEGARGFIDAYKASTGERAWRFWTMPLKPGDPGSETWIGRAMEHGCTAAWLTGTYDPESKLLYWPTGNPLPRLQRRRAQGRQPLLRLRTRARREHRQAEVVLPIHAA